MRTISQKRLNYFTGQLLTASDFTDEQQYHVEALQSHNRYMHTWGIAQGLNVEKSGTKNVTISRGMAIDGQGRQIILDQLKEIDLSTSTAPALYLTISYSEKETDFKEGEGENGNIRITEEPLIDHSQDKPGEQSQEIVLAKLVFDRENDTLDSIDLKDRRHVKTVGGDIEANSIIFSRPSEEPSEQLPVMKSVDGPGLAIISENTYLQGNLEVSGTLTGRLGEKMVGKAQIAQGSVSLDQLNTVQSSGTAEIGAKSETKVDFTEPSLRHRFFITSIIPVTPDSAIEWRWQVEKEKDQVSHVLVVKNLSRKKIEVEFTYYEIQT